MKPHIFVIFVFLLTCSLALSACTSSGSECVDNSDCLSTHYCANSGGVFFASGVCTIRASTTSSKDPSDDMDTVDDTAIFDDTSNDIETDTALNTDTNPETDTNSETDTDAETDTDTPSGDECLIDMDCGFSILGTWDECFFLDFCANIGQKERSRTKVQCLNGYCSTENTVESTECNRDTTGEQCGDPNPAPIWEECLYATECSKSAINYGVIPYMQCKEGTCSEPSPAGIGNAERCNRITTGNPCTTSIGDAGSCTISGTCRPSLLPLDPGLEPL